jgi:hypothetical protein
LACRQRLANGLAEARIVKQSDCASQRIFLPWAVLAFLQNAMRAAGAAAAFRSHTKLFAQAAHGGNTLRDRLANLPFSHCLTDTNIHFDTSEVDAPILIANENSCQQ